MDTPVALRRAALPVPHPCQERALDVPFIGWYLNRSGQVPIDSNSPRSLIASLNRGVTTLKQGLPLVLFPEGGRAATGDLQIHDVRLRLHGHQSSGPLFPSRSSAPRAPSIHIYALHPRPFAIVVGDPLPTAGLTTRDADALTQRLYQSISVYPTLSTPSNKNRKKSRAQRG